MEKTEIHYLCNKIYDLEKKHNLLYKNIQGVPIWQFIRMEMYYKLTQDTKVFTKPHTDFFNKFAMVKNMPRLLYNSLFNNPIQGNYQKDFLVIDHARKLLINDEFIDIYSKYLLDTLNKNDYDVLEYAYRNKHYTKKETNRKYLDILRVKLILPFIFSKVKFTLEELSLIRELEKDIEHLFGLKYDIENIFTKHIIRFKVYYNYHSRLIKKRNPKTIYVLVSYANPPLIAAAKDNNVKVIELQHGTISPYHLGYNFPDCDKEELKCFPDMLYTFGEYWNTAADYPIPKENIKVYGFPYMKERLEQYKGYKKIDKQVLFISQGVIGKDLSEYAYQLAMNLPEYKFIYKLHPGEYDRWKDEYDTLVETDKLENFQVIDNNEKSIYRYFAESEFQIGVFSTAIFEGMALNCKTILVSLPGIEYMNKLIEQKAVILIRTKDELFKAVKNYSAFTVKKISSEYFFN